MSVTAFVSHEDCALHDPGWRHPDHQGRLPAIVRAVQRDMVALWEPLDQQEGVPAPESELLRAHDAGYLARIRARAAESAAAGRTLELEGVPVSGATWDAVRAAAGVALTAVDAVLSGAVRNGFALARPSGRDARRDTPGGHSLVNTVAVAARALVESRGMERVLVLSWGTRPAEALAALLARDPRIRVAAVHRGALHGEGVRAVAEAQRAALGDEGADFVLLSAGFDVLATDPEGGLGLAPADLHPLTLQLRGWAEDHAGGRLVSVLEGGYDAEATARGVVHHLRALAGVEPA